MKRPLLSRVGSLYIVVYPYYDRYTQDCHNCKYDIHTHIVIRYSPYPTGRRIGLYNIDLCIGEKYNKYLISELNEMNPIPFGNVTLHALFRIERIAITNEDISHCVVHYEYGSIFKSRIHGRQDIKRKRIKDYRDEHKSY